MKSSASHDVTPTLIVSAAPDIASTIIKMRGNQGLVDVNKRGATMGLNESCCRTKANTYPAYSSR